MNGRQWNNRLSFFHWNHRYKNIRGPVVRVLLSYPAVNSAPVVHSPLPNDFYHVIILIVHRNIRFIIKVPRLRSLFVVWYSPPKLSFRGKRFSWSLPSKSKVECFTAAPFLFCSNKTSTTVTCVHTGHRSMSTKRTVHTAPTTWIHLVDRRPVNYVWTHL
jgi:hypothetical protein